MTTPTPAGRLRRPATEAGSAGLRHSNGVVMEEYRYQLAGKVGRMTFAEMERDPIVSAVLLAIWQFVVDAGFHIEPAPEPQGTQTEDAEGDTPAKAAAKFVEECLDDTSHTWPDFMSELQSMLTYGWAGRSWSTSCARVSSRSRVRCRRRSMPTGRSGGASSPPGRRTRSPAG